MVEIYNKRLLLEELVENGISKLWREKNSISIRSARFATELAGFVRKANGKLTLTKKATKLLEANKRNQLFRQFFRCYGIRTFEGFLLWFGFVTVDKQKVFINSETDKFKRTDLLKRIFKIDY